MSEKVLVFPSAVLDNLPTINGFTGQAIQYVRPIFDHPDTGFRPRSEVETDDRWKQVIPYIVVRDRNRQYLVYNRDTGGGEARLHGRWSLGVGGHINEADGLTPTAAYVNGMVREAREEIGCDIVDMELHCTRVGCLYDPSTNVGRVHFGFVYALEFVKTMPSLTSITLSEWKFLDKATIRANRDRFEVWSRHVIDHYLRV